MDMPLNFNKQISNPIDRERAEPQDELARVLELVQQTIDLVRRQFPLFVFITGCCLALGFVYLLTAPAKFTSHAILLIDSSKLRFLQDQQTAVSEVPIDTEQVETQVEILKSENIGLSVIKELKLNQDPEFVGSGSSLFGWLTSSLGSDEEKSETKSNRRALAAFLAKRNITRVARTYVLDIGFTSLSAGRAAEIANAIADAYIVDQLEAKYQATRRASGWLQDRIKELRKQASDADRAVLEYKEKNKIVSIGGASSTGPRLLGEQQLEDLNTQLGTARATSEDAKAKLERITDVMQRDVPDASVTDSLHSDVINRLRNNYLDMAAKEAIWSARYGSAHLAAVNLRTQMAELRRSIHDELGRIAESYKSDYEISKSRVEGLERELQKLVANSQVTNRDRLGLTDLESSAKVYHSIYDSFLQRYMEAIQQQSFPITEARVISAAAAPEHKSGPLSHIVLAFAGAIGLVLSFGTAILREAVDRVFRTVHQVETNLHARCLTIVPRLLAPNQKAKQPAMLRSTVVAALNRRAPTTVSSPPMSIGTPAGMMLSQASEKQKGAGRRPSEIDGAINRSIASSRPFMRQVVEDPLSAFAEAFRSIKVTAEISGSCVIGITSSVPGEGKSTVSSNLAMLMAHTGKRVILLDGDLRNPSLTRALVGNPKVGILEVLDGSASLESALNIDEGTGLRFLPAVVSSRAANSSDVLASDSFKEFVDRLREDYDFVIVDLSPVAPIVDVRATVQFIESYIYVVEWGRTEVSLVKRQLSRFPELHDRLLGVVLNKADVRVLERYDRYQYGGYYGQYPYVSPESVE
jgi:capsular exopolysaccharide synthesis family protein